jgi:hypothetical protein
MKRLLAILLLCSSLAWGQAGGSAVLGGNVAFSGNAGGPVFVTAISAVATGQHPTITLTSGAAIGSVVVVLPARATTYYIGANGSDSYDGTEKTHTTGSTGPFLHAPGMPNCASSCAAVTPAAGDSYIFRGGDTWHRSASTSDSTDVPIGGQWTWSWSGTSGSCSFPNTTSSCIYVGVDVTWFSGGSFARPQINLDNPLWVNSTHQDGSHIGWVTACTYNDSGITGWDLTGRYVIIDNFEFLGKCWTSLPTYNVDSEFGADTAANGAVAIK